MTKQKVLNILIVTFVIALAVTLVYAVQFYKAVREIHEITSVDC